MTKSDKKNDGALICWIVIWFTTLNHTLTHCTRHDVFMIWTCSCEASVGGAALPVQVSGAWLVGVWRRGRALGISIFAKRNGTARKWILDLRATNHHFSLKIPEISLYFRVFRKNTNRRFGFELETCGRMSSARYQYDVSCSLHFIVFWRQL